MQNLQNIYHENNRNSLTSRLRRPTPHPSAIYKLAKHAKCKDTMFCNECNPNNTQNAESIKRVHLTVESKCPQSVKVNVMPTVPTVTNDGVITIPVKLQICQNEISKQPQVASDVVINVESNTKECAKDKHPKLIFQNCGLEYEQYLEQLTDETEQTEAFGPHTNKKKWYECLPTTEYMEPYLAEDYCYSQQSTEVQTDLSLGQHLLSKSLNSISDPNADETCKPGCTSKCSGVENGLDWSQIVVPHTNFPEMVKPRLTDKIETIFDRPKSVDDVPLVSKTSAEIISDMINQQIDLFVKSDAPSTAAVQLKPLTIPASESNQTTVTPKTVFVYGNHCVGYEPYAGRLLDDIICSDNSTLDWNQIIVPQKPIIRKLENLTLSNVPATFKPTSVEVLTRSGKNSCVELKCPKLTGVSNLPTISISCSKIQCPKSMKTCTFTKSDNNLPSELKNPIETNYGIVKLASKCSCQKIRNNPQFIAVETQKFKGANNIKFKTKILLKDISSTTHIKVKSPRIVTTKKKTRKVSSFDIDRLKTVTCKYINRKLLNRTYEQSKDSSIVSALSSTSKKTKEDMDSLTIQKTSNSAFRQDLVFEAIKACEEELKPVKEALARVRNKLHKLNMPEVDSLLRKEEYGNRVDNAQYKQDFAQFSGDTSGKTICSCQNCEIKPISVCSSTHSNRTSTSHNTQTKEVPLINPVEIMPTDLYAYHENYPPHSYVPPQYNPRPPIAIELRNFYTAGMQNFITNPYSVRPAYQQPVPTPYNIIYSPRTYSQLKTPSPRSLNNENYRVPYRTIKKRNKGIQKTGQRNPLKKQGHYQPETEESTSSADPRDSLNQVSF